MKIDFNKKECSLLLENNDKIKLISTGDGEDLYVKNIDGKLNVYSDSRNNDVSIKPYNEMKCSTENFDKCIDYFNKCFNIFRDKVADDYHNNDNEYKAFLEIKSKMDVATFTKNLIYRCGIKKDEHIIIEGPVFSIDKTDYETNAYLFASVLGNFLKQPGSNPKSEDFNKLLSTLRHKTYTGRYYKKMITVPAFGFYYEMFLDMVNQDKINISPNAYIAQCRNAYLNSKRKIKRDDASWRKVTSKYEDEYKAVQKILKR